MQENILFFISLDFLTCKEYLTKLYINKILEVIIYLPLILMEKMIILYSKTLTDMDQNKYNNKLLNALLKTFFFNSQKIKFRIKYNKNSFFTDLN